MYDVYNSRGKDLVEKSIDFFCKIGANYNFLNIAIFIF